MSRQLRVCNLNVAADRHDLAYIFAVHGTVSRTQVLPREPGAGTVVGLVDMGTDAQAQQALEQLNGATYCDRLLSVGWAADAPAGPTLPEFFGSMNTPAPAAKASAGGTPHDTRGLAAPTHASDVAEMKSWGMFTRVTQPGLPLRPDPARIHPAMTDPAGPH